MQPAGHTFMRGMSILAPNSLVGRFVRYGLASATGTVVDLAVFVALLALAAEPGWAAAFGYTCGTAWHWWFSSRMVFADRLAQPGRARARQQVLFIASAFLGLALTTVIVSLGTMGGLSPALAKFAAMCAAFTSVWLVRLMFVFSERDA